MRMDGVRFLRSLGYPYLMERYLTVFFISREICLNIPSFSIHTPIPLTLLFPHRVPLISLSIFILVF
jgi:hypothetical protein